MPGFASGIFDAQVVGIVDNAKRHPSKPWPIVAPAAHAGSVASHGQKSCSVPGSANRFAWRRDRTAYAGAWVDCRCQQQVEETTMAAEMKAPDRTAVASDAFLPGIDALLPAVRERAGEVEQRGVISREVMNWLTEANVFRAMQPRQWGGLELDPATFFEGMVRIASACGSTGWVASVVGIHPWHIAMFDQRAQSDVWSGNPDAMASTSYAPTGQVRRVTDGFRLSGRWSYSSGVDHCDWVIVGAAVPDDEPGGAGPEFRSFLVPRGDFTVDQETWHVTGLVGTGSKDVVIKDAFVPECRTHSSTQVHERTDPGRAVNHGPLYQLPWSTVFPYAIGSPAIGAAVGALPAFIDNNRQRVSIAGGRTVSASSALHLRLADSLTTIEAARARLTLTWQDFLARVTRGEEVRYVLRTRCRYEEAHAIAQCANAVYRALEVNGGRTMNADEALQRFFRDLLAMRNHIAAALDLNASAYALAKLGVPPPPFNRAQRVVI
jgi:3-hydroxy-9,10-secoandrosta-1,3,5(10)-triene-9,17-dione monooxygenase